jgi:hypothetical protein
MVCDNRYPIGGRQNTWNDNEQRRSYRHIIYNNVINSMEILLRQSENATDLVVAIRDRQLHSLPCVVNGATQTPCLICKPSAGGIPSTLPITTSSGINGASPTSAGGISAGGGVTLGGPSSSITSTGIGAGAGTTTPTTIISSTAISSPVATAVNGNEVVSLTPVMKYPTDELELQASQYRLDPSLKPFVEAIQDAARFRDDWFDAKLSPEAKAAVDAEHANVEHDALVEKLLSLHIASAKAICELIADYIQAPIYDLTYIINRLVQRSLPPIYVP